MLSSLPRALRLATTRASLTLTTFTVALLALIIGAQFAPSAVLAAPDFPAPLRADAGDAVGDPFLTRLLDEINHRRDEAGTPHLAFVPRPANDALDVFLGETAPTIAWPGPCSHQLVDGGYSWDYVHSTTGFDAQAHGEVLACPGPDPYWTPDRAAELWWESPVHFGILYADPDANAIACSAYGARGGAKKKTIGAAMAILCVTYGV